MKGISGQKRWIGLLAVSLTSGLGGCGEPAPTGDRPRIDGTIPTPRRIQFTRKQIRGEEKETVLQKVREGIPEGDTNSVQAWAQGYVKGLGGDALFETWDGTLVAPNRYEVRFTFTHVGNDGLISLQGFAWDFDLMLGLVGPRREMSEDELDRLGKRNTYEHLNRRLEVSSPELIR